MTGEIRPIPGYPGYYAAEDGTIISTRTEPPKVLSTQLHKGYLHLNVKTGLGRNTKKKEPVHKLVLLAFHGPKPSGEFQGRHLNGDSLDNHYTNLSWGTPSENTRDAMVHGTHVCLRRGEEHVASRLTESEVREIHSLANQGMPQRLIADRFGVHQKHVSDIKLQRTWKHLWVATP